MFHQHTLSGLRVGNVGICTPEICWWLEIGVGGVRLREKQRKLLRMKAWKSRMSVRRREYSGMPGIEMWFAGESYFMCKLVLEELVIIWGFGVGIGARGYVRGMDMTVKRMPVAGLQGDSRRISRVDLYQIMGRF